MHVNYSDHARDRMLEDNISDEEVERTLSHPYFLMLAARQAMKFSSAGLKDAKSWLLLYRDHSLPVS